MFKLLKLLIVSALSVYAKFDVCQTCEEIASDNRRIIIYGDNSCGATTNVEAPPGFEHSHLSGGEVCSSLQIFNNASAWCADRGMRLCTKDEIDSNVAAGTGCGYDLRRIWSSTPCNYSRYWTLPGHNKHWTLGTYVPPRLYNECSHSTEKHYVRCCADYEPVCRSCEHQLSIPDRLYYIRFGELACGATPHEKGIPNPSDPPGKPGMKCSFDINYTSAVKYCNNYNMRLCTPDELRINTAHGTGCGYDLQRIWTEIKCQEKSHYTIAGHNKYYTLYDGKRPNGPLEEGGFDSKM